jgi:hypothetical protein
MLAAVVALCVVLSAAPPPQDPGDRPFDFLRDPAFGDPTPSLGAYLKSEKARKNRVHHFCAVGYASAVAPETNSRVWIHWKEGHRMILWESGPVTSSRRILNLKKDVASSEAGVQGSSYRVSRQWVNQVIRECELRGHKIQAVRAK